MAGEGARYEVTEIKAIRGTESKTIASKQQDGWELVTQQEGRLRTTMTFRRPKPKPPWQLWAALGAAGVILVSVITVGALLEDDSAASQADAEAGSNTAHPAPEGEAAPSSAADPMICETTPVEDTCKFGQTAIYRDSVRSGEVELEITVDAPVEFTPSEDAFIMYDRPSQAVSVYFPVTIKTIKNTSPEFAADTIHPGVTNAEQGGTGVESVTDGDIGSFAVGRAEGMSAGESVSVKDGWTLATLDGVEYNLRIDGLAGYAITFTR